MAWEHRISACEVHKKNTYIQAFTSSIVQRIAMKPVKQKSNTAYPSQSRRLHITETNYGWLSNERRG